MTDYMVDLNALDKDGELLQQQKLKLSQCKSKRI